MNSLTDWLTNWFKEALIGGITKNFEGMFDEVNTKVTDIAAQVGQTPEGWNSGVFSMIKSLSDTVVIPIAGMILTFVLCYELIHMIIDHNNLQNFETWIFFKWMFKTFCAVYIVTHTFDIVLGVFGIAQHVIDGSAGIITGSLNANVSLATLQTTLESMEWYELIGLFFETQIVSLCMGIMAIFIMIIVWGRMIEIYLTVSIAPIPLSTMVNRDEVCCKRVKKIAPHRQQPAHS